MSEPPFLKRFEAKVAELVNLSKPEWKNTPLSAAILALARRDGVKLKPEVDDLISAVEELPAFTLCLSLGEAALRLYVHNVIYFHLVPDDYLSDELDDEVWPGTANVMDVYRSKYTIPAPVDIELAARPS